MRISNLEWKNNGEEISVLGIATNFDTLSRQLILFKNAPIIQSVEFKNATESLDLRRQRGEIYYDAQDQQGIPKINNKLFFLKKKSAKKW